MASQWNWARIPQPPRLHPDRRPWRRNPRLSPEMGRKSIRKGKQCPRKPGPRNPSRAGSFQGPLGSVSCLVFQREKRMELSLVPSKSQAHHFFNKSDAGAPALWTTQVEVEGGPEGGLLEHRVGSLKGKAVLCSRVYYGYYLSFKYLLWLTCFFINLPKKPGR